MKKLLFALTGLWTAISIQAAAFQDAQVPDGVKADDWSEIKAAHKKWEYSFRKAEGGYTSSHPGHGWHAHFDERGFLLHAQAGTWKWGLELEAYGFAGSLEPQRNGSTAKDGAQTFRLTRKWDDDLQEWYVNDPQGLEHGFIINHRPAGGGRNLPAVIEMGVRGSLRARDGGGSSVTFVNAADEAVLSYSGLKVWDANGRVLPARMSVPDDNHVRLEVLEDGARYPLTVDPVAAPVYVKAFNPDGGDNFGNAIAISGDTAVVGAYFEDGDGAGVNPPGPNGRGESGAAYVFVRTGGVWSQQAYLKASNPGIGDYFGKSVAISGDTIVVGAHYEDSGSTGVNSVPTENVDQAGAAYIFVRNGTAWSQQAYLKASNTGADDQFGFSVAVSGDIVVVGAPLEDGGGKGINPPSSETATGAGAVYVFARNGTTWSQQAYVKSSNPAANDSFGYSVAISGETMVAGAYLEGGVAGGSGAAFVFVRNGSVWTQQAYLKASNPGGNDNFGFSVAISGDTIVCGAIAEDNSGTGVNPPDVPAPPGANSGAAYVFIRNGVTWSQQAYLKASNTGFNDQFGYSVGVSGDTVVVGAQQEDGAGIKVNPAPNDGAADSGAAYVFIRTGNTWSPQAYVKAINTGAGDLFGCSVAVSGDTILIGASGEDGGGMGINPLDTGFLASAGAAYIYTGLGPAPDQDSDGIADILETYFGTSPTNPGGSPWTVSVSGGKIHIRWPEASPTGVTVTPEWSPDLVTWLASGESLNGIPARTITVTSGGGNIRDAVLDTTGLARAFLRLKLTSP